MVNATGDGGLSDTGFMRGQKPGRLYLQICVEHALPNWFCPLYGIKLYFVLF